MCTVSSVVTDNANNMRSMRKSLALSNNENVRSVFTYGCSAHLANLIAKDLIDHKVVDKVKTVVKYFRNTHIAKAKFRDAKGTNLCLPIDVKWNSYYDCLKSFADNYLTLTTLASTYKHIFDKDVVRLLTEENLLAASENLCEKLKVVGTAVDRLQANDCYLSDAYEEWITMRKYFQGENGEMDDICNVNADLMCFNDRFNLAITVYHSLANLLDPRYKGRNLLPEHRTEAMNFIEIETFLSEILKFQAEAQAPYEKYLFNSSATQNISPYIWWKSIENSGVIKPDLKFTKFCTKLFTCNASTAGLERLFSTYGFIHSKIRNRLGVDKSAKLVSLFKIYNK